MRKSTLFLLVLVMLAPVICYAGSATSRWDVTIGGFVKADFGYADQGVSADSYVANRKSHGNTENVYDEYGNYYNAAGETRLNFLIKGPETWGAKSSAFVEADFRPTGNSSYGLFNLRHAFLKFDWPTTSLIIGQTWQPWGYLNSYVYLNVNDLLTFNRGQRQPQITLSKKFGNQFTTAISLFSPVNTLSSTVGEQVVNSYSRSGYPQLAGEINYKSECLGKVGPWMLQFGLGGFYGIEKVAFNSATGSTTGTTTSTFTAGGNAATATHFSSDNINAWGISFKGFIPIIPQKKPGALANSLALAFQTFTGQDWNGVYLASAVQVPSYRRAGFDFAAPTFYGGWGQIMYYFTDRFFTNLEYGQIKFNESRSFRASNPDVPLNLRQYIVNFIYDVNPAVRLGVEFSRYYTKYAAPKSGLDDYGQFNSVRIAAIYFF